MSQETLEWLNENTLIGFTDERGHAWHYREGSGNHYPGAVPVDDVIKRLFHWEAVETPVRTSVPQEGKPPLTVTADAYKAIVRSDTREVLLVAKKSRATHQYKEWLLDQVADILDDDMQIGSAGLLRGGGVAFVTVEMTENFTTPEGVEFRPHLLATTSHDATLSTTYNKCNTFVVCDNTMSMGLAEGRKNGQIFKVRHTKNSVARLDDAREALAIVHKMADEFAAEIEALCATTVTDDEFQRFLDGLVPVVDEEEGKSSRGRTLAMEKQAKIGKLYRDDERAATWNGTAFGVLQAVNTYNQHERQIVKGERAERNMLNQLWGLTDKDDREVLTVLESVLA